jgi:hypothetical protein
VVGHFFESGADNLGDGHFLFESVADLKTFNFTTP